MSRVRDERGEKGMKNPPTASGDNTFLCFGYASKAFNFFASFAFLLAALFL